MFFAVMRVYYYIVQYVKIAKTATHGGRSCPRNRLFPTHRNSGFRIIESPSPPPPIPP